MAASMEPLATPPASASPSRGYPPLWQPVLYAALAGGMGWGIRGQYGHESGAMVAGLLVSLALVLLFCPRAASLSAARAVAFGTVAVGFGGSMTYAQTVGLTHDPKLLGNTDALLWGMLGLGVKGAVWIGFCGAFLGMGLSGVRYRSRELLVLFGVMVVLMWLGTQLLNQPYDPRNKVLPALYFSSSWRFFGEEAVLKPRPENWGGLLLALLGLIAYVGWARKDRLARNLGFWAMLGGALGFPGGQCLQSFHAWNKELFTQGWFSSLEPFMNWWNMMETTFGAVWGGVLALGLWLNRARIDSLEAEGEVRMPAVLELGLVALHGWMLVASEFLDDSLSDRAFESGLTMGLVPTAAIAAGRYWPYVLCLPITAIHICGKTLRELFYKNAGNMPLPLAWGVYVAVPLVGMTLLAALLVRQARVQGCTLSEGRGFLRWGLLSSTWLYFLLNHAFFRWPWPWLPWTYRTTNGILFTVAAIGLTLLAARAKPAPQ